MRQIYMYPCVKIYKNNCYVKKARCRRLCVILYMYVCYTYIHRYIRVGMYMYTHTHVHRQPLKESIKNWKWNSLVVQCLGLGTFSARARGLGSIPSWGTKILQVERCGQKRKQTGHGVCLWEGAWSGWRRAWEERNILFIVYNFVF